MQSQKKTKVIAADLPVMKSCCATCPFKQDERGRWQDVRLANTVIGRTLFKGHQICHGTEGNNRKANNRCKGAFDHNLEIYKRMGYSDLVK
jgi:hypothetical protein